MAASRRCHSVERLSYFETIELLSYIRHHIIYEMIFFIASLQCESGPSNMSVVVVGVVQFI